MSMISEAYDGYKLHQEKIWLSPENGQKFPNGRCILRALNWFVFMKNGKQIAPLYENCTPNFWKGVDVYGFVASLTGDARWHIMGGFWSYDWGGKEMALVRIDRLVGLSKESNMNWRGGSSETALWLETLEGFAYALLDPADEYRETWTPVVNSWKPPGNSTDPTYQDVDPHGVKPTWWKGIKAWNYVQAQEVKTVKRASGSKASRKQTAPNPKTPKNRAKRRVQPVGSDAEGEDQVFATKRRKRETDSASVPISAGNPPSPEVWKSGTKRQGSQRRPVLHGETELKDDAGKGKAPPGVPASSVTSAPAPERSAPAANAPAPQDSVSGSQGSIVNSLGDGINGMGLGLSQRPEPLATLAELQCEPPAQAAPAGSDLQAESVPVNAEASSLLIPTVPSREEIQVDAVRSSRTVVSDGSANETRASDAGGVVGCSVVGAIIPAGGATANDFEIDTPSPALTPKSGFEPSDPDSALPSASISQELCDTISKACNAILANACTPARAPTPVPTAPAPVPAGTAPAQARKNVAQAHLFQSIKTLESRSSAVKGRSATELDL